MELTISREEMSLYLKRWRIDSKLPLVDKIIDEVFAANPGRWEPSVILRQVIILKKRYHAGNFDVETMAEHICSIRNIPERLERGDITLVSEIANCQMRYGARYQCFASKFCSFHNKDAFPIYDSYVREVVYDWCKTQRVGRERKQVTRTYLEEYPKFVECYKKMVVSCHLAKRESGIKWKNIDKYIWQLGKEHYKPNSH